MIRGRARIAKKIGAAGHRREAAARWPRHSDGQRGNAAQRQRRQKADPDALQRGRFAARREATNQTLLDDLPRGFRGPKGANCVDLYLGNYYKSRDDELEARAQLREVLLTGMAAANELRRDDLSVKDRRPLGAATRLERPK